MIVGEGFVRHCLFGGVGEGVDHGREMTSVLQCWKMSCFDLCGLILGRNLFDERFDVGVVRFCWRVGLESLDS